MAWRWKQGRPSLLAIIGLGVLGYKMLHKGRVTDRYGQKGVRMMADTQQRRLQATPTPLGRQTKTAFLGGLRVTELAKRVVQEVREDNCLGQAAQTRVLPDFCCLSVSPLLGDATGVSADSPPHGSHPGVSGTAPPWRGG